MPFDTQLPRNTSAIQAGETIPLAEASGPPRTDGFISEVTKRVIGSEAIAIEPIEGLGMSNKVVKVATARGPLVIRSNGAQHLRKYEIEAWCLEQAHQIGILVPRVIATGVLGERAYSVADYIEGSTVIDDRFDGPRVWQILGSYASKLNAIPITGFGTDMTANGVFSQTWPEMVEAELRMVFRDDYWERSGLLTPAQVATVTSFVERCAEIDSPPGICQWDIGCNNARIKNRDFGQVFLLDLEMVVAGPVPQYQLACVAKPFGVSSKEMVNFSAGYGLSDTQLHEVLQDVAHLVVLKFMRSVRWAQDRRPNELLARSRDAREAIYSLMWKE